jgi:hypothetical protein
MAEHKNRRIRICLCLTLLAAGIPAHAQDSQAAENTRQKSETGIGLNFNVGNVSFGGVFPFAQGSGSNAFELGVEVLPFGIEYLGSGLGIRLCPLNYFYTDHGEIQNHRTSLINLGLYWDILGGGNNIYLGPFTSFNYLFLDNGVRWEKSTITLGIQGGFRMGDGFFHWPLISGETGIRIIDSKANAFLSVKVDFMPLLAAGILGIGSAVLRSGSGDDDD